MSDAKRLRALPIASACAAAVLVVALLSFAGPCPVHDDGSVSPCNPTSHVLIGLAAAALAVALARVATARPAVPLAAVQAALGLAIAALPGTALPLCMMQTMRCNTVMRPTCMLLGTLILALGIADALARARQEGGPAL